MPKSYRYIGIDVGSTTVKGVAMGPEGEVLWKDYRRHHAKQAEYVRELLRKIETRFSDHPLKTFITGSGGRALAPHIDATYIQEVNAATIAVERLYPDVGSCIELGGQDAKVIIFKPDEHGRKNTLCSMNDKCAGGTGATIDKILHKLSISSQRASRVSTKGKTIHPVAAKCGVFAETDLVGLSKSGIDDEEIVVSLCAAIVKQNLEVLVRGNILRDKVLLLGGPHKHIPALTEIWRQQIARIWKLHGYEPRDLPIEELVYVPRDAEYVPSIGAVFYGIESENLDAETAIEDTQQHRPIFSGLEPLDEYISTRGGCVAETSGSVRPGLVKHDLELAAFKKKYSMPEFVAPEIDTSGPTEVWLGLDGGSTSTKLALIDNTGELLYKDYVLSAGNPIVDTRQLFETLSNWATEKNLDLAILGTGVTGYASDILEAAFRFDNPVVETVAHMRSAQFYCGDTDIICDVGGQDIKVLFLRDGRVSDFRLNTQCSAGNGYFLQWMAEQFNIPLTSYADMAFRARRAPSFNCGCTVFLEQDKVNFQQLGWSEEEIMAGLALVLPLNIWNYVVQESNIAKFGNRVVLQGGTQKNLAAVKAQVDFLNKKIPDARVVVHRYADICGALGAALESRARKSKGPSSFIGVEQASGIRFVTTNNASTRCELCNNRCPRTFVDIEHADRTIRFVSGYNCERGAGDRISAEVDADTRTRDLDLARYAAERVFEETRLPEPPAGIRTTDPQAASVRSRTCVALPRLLNLFYYAPFFDAYLRAIGVSNVVVGKNTSPKLWEKGSTWGSIDPCFPAKVATAHVYDLMTRTAVNSVLLPIVTHLPSHVEKSLGNNACVIQMGTSEVVEAAFTREKDHFAECGVEFWKPFVRLDRPREAEAQLLDYFGPRLLVTPQENAWAVDQAYRAQEGYLEDLRERGRRVIEDLVASRRMGIVVLAHPYHHDPGLNHGLLNEFARRGYPVLPIEALPVDSEFLDPLFGTDTARNDPASSREIGDVWARNFNRNTNHKIWAAKVVSRHPNLAGIDLSSFKCGHDAPTYSYVENIMNTSMTPHFLFHDIDQNKPHSSMKIRIDTFHYFLKLEEEKLRGRLTA